MSSSYARPILVDGESHHLLEALRVETNSVYDEDWLQNLIDRHPECLPITEIEPALQAAISVCREMPTPNGPIDNILLTPNGDIVLIETKLWKNPEARRTVVAQALDYAACVFEMDYEGFERAILKARPATVAKIKHLYELFAATSEKDEAAFVDAVETNLQRGRALILVVGDGIRGQTKQLAELVQSHAGARFTFALVELAIFKIPNSSQMLVCPRTLAQTKMIERGVIEITEGRGITIRAPATPMRGIGKVLPESITSDQFMEDMARLDRRLPAELKSMLERLAEEGVTAQFQRSLHLRWESSSRSVSLGYISRNGEIWTDTVSNGVPADLARRYLESLASALGATLFMTEKGKLLLRQGAKTLNIGNCVGRLANWVDVAAGYVAHLAAEHNAT